ncbi:protocadherin Fat 4-like [Haliotis asinina]|uniref:protocadherin Fat 4-like n=1 Tax=Haliotis asinina TaxID=109174 RepID=UPI003531EA8F
MAGKGRHFSLLVLLLGYMGANQAYITVTEKFGQTHVVRSKFKVEQKLYEIKVDTNETSFLCTETTTEPNFSIKKIDPDTNFWVYFEPSEHPAELSANDYTINATCVTAEPDSDFVSVKVFVRNNRPPVVHPGSLVTIMIPVTTTNGQIIGSVNATDPDGDLLTYNVSMQAGGFNMDSGGQISTTKNMAELDAISAVISASVSDTAGHTVGFQVRITLDMLNTRPVDNTIPATRNVQEDATSGVIHTFDVRDTTLFDTLGISLRVSPSSGDSKFKIESNQIQIVGPFDFDTVSTYNLTVMLNDGYKRTSYDITVNIIDANDPPSCTSKTYIVTADENTLDPISISAFGINDASGQTHTLTLSNTLFSVFRNKDPMQIKPNVGLDCESNTPIPNPVTVNITVTDNFGASGTCAVTIQCNDLNDNSPEFVTSSYSFLVAADMAIGTSIGKVSATDKDITKTTNGMVEYKLNMSDPVGVVKVLPDGDVLINTDISGMYGNSVSGEIVATDKGAGSRQSTATFLFKWNEAPDITNLPTSGSISEDTTVELLILELVTTDPEGDAVMCRTGTISQAGAPFTVKLVSPGKYGIYYTQSVQLNSLPVKTIQIGVICEDGKGGSVVKNYDLQLQPNERPQATCSPTATTQVSAKAIKTNDVVYAIPVTDKENNPISVVTFCTPDLGLFVYDSDTVSLKATTSFHGVTQSSITCTLRISDGKHPPMDDVTCFVTITITDQNQAPVINNDKELVKHSELTKPGVELFKFDITDDDTVDISYEVDPVAFTSYFNVNASTGSVTLLKYLDFETLPKIYTITIVADDSVLKATGTVTVEVTNDNDSPVFEKNMYIVSLNEGEALASSVDLGLKVMDTDVGDTHSFRVLAPHSSTFTIDGTTLKNLVPIDLDAAGSQTTYDIVVEADDNKGGVATTNVSIILQPINDNTPYFEANSFSNCVIGVSLPTSTEICSGTAKDDDAALQDKTLTYSLGASSHPGVFKMVGNGIFLQEALQQAYYGQLMSVEVVATDAGTKPGNLSGSVNVAFEWNKPPTCPTLVGLQLAEDAKAQDIPGSDIMATDPEPADTVTVSMTCSPGSTEFSIQNKKVHYSGTPALSFKNTPSYTCVLTCADGNGGTDEKNFTITITKNKPPNPSCSALTATIPDALTVNKGATILTFPDDDPENDDITYSILMSPASALFQVNPDTGVLSASADLKEQKADFVEVTATLRDPYENTAVCKAFITINNVNKKPVLKQANTRVFVKEDAADGDVMFTLDIEDPDTHVATYVATIKTLPEEAAANFEAEVAGKVISIKLRAGRKLDYETLNKYTFFVNVNDGCWTSDDIVTYMDIDDVNEAPGITNGLKYSAQFQEDQVNHCVNLGCGGFDPDIGDVDKWKWTITDPAKYKDSFTISGADCTLCLRAAIELDPELRDRKADKELIDLKVEFVDKGDLPTAKVKFDVAVTVLEVNDNDPIFEKASYFGQVFNTDVEGKEILAMVADDLDALTNGMFTCREKRCDAALDGYITIGADCKVRLSSSMATGFVGGQNFKCEVEVVDNGNPQRKSETKVDIQYVLVTTVQPPPTQTPDPNANANANANANSNANANGNANGNIAGGANGALNLLSNSAGSGSNGFSSLSPGAMAGLICGAVAIGGALTAAAVVGGIQAKKRCAARNSNKQNTRTYKVSSRESNIKNNRVSTASSIKFNMLNDPGVKKTQITPVYYR